MPPAKNDTPSTSNKFPKTDPVKEASTMPIRPAFKVKNEMISSTALPNVAFSKPPILGPLTIARLSVALPINPDSAMMLAQLMMNIGISGQSLNEPNMISGTPMNASNVNIRFTAITSLQWNFSISFPVSD